MLALTGLSGLDLPRPDLAALARRAENDFVGVPSGIMDQSASLLCQAGHALLLDCLSGQTSAVPLDPAAAGLALLIVDTGARHALADGRYAPRRRRMRARRPRALGVRVACATWPTPALPPAWPTRVLRRRARHVVTENERVLDAVALLRRRRPGRARRGC